MLRSVFFVSVLSICLSCSTSCERKPGRPSSELCMWMSEAGIWECEDAAGISRHEDAGNLMCTTMEGYALLERYVDAKEKQVRDLERRLKQCRSN